MIDPKVIDDLAKKISATLPDGIRQMQNDMEKGFQAVLQAAFTRMDLVTREEFDVQQGVLARSREKLEKLEKRFAELEAQLQQKDPSGTKD